MQSDTSTIAPLLLTSEQAADLCNLSITSWKTQARCGRVGPVPLRFGKSVRWVRSELEDWIACGAPPRTQWMEYSQARREAQIARQRTPIEPLVVPPKPWPAAPRQVR
jgi:predicted DNA-binding transcriptional regulator AlpA